MAVDKLPYDKQVAMEVLFTGHGPTTFKGHKHDLSRSDLPELFLENAEMPGVILAGANLQRAKLMGSNLAGARLEQANLQDAWLNHVDLRNCILFQTNFIRADLRQADLRGADLTRANFQGAYLDGAKLDDDGVEQLKKAASLYETSGLTDGQRTALEKHRPGLFRKPSKPEDDPDNF